MQISRLYSNVESIFRPIDLNCSNDADLMNVVYGDVTKGKYEGKRDSHNLGKTTLVYLIDFMFLKDISGTRHFLETHSHRFPEFDFFLELALRA